AQAPTFSPPTLSPLTTSTNYTGPTNGSLPPQPIVPGKIFDRFIQIWLENTDFDVANGTVQFRALAARGVLMDRYYALTHPSQPNYIAAAGGSFWGLGDDNLVRVPAAIPTVVDLLEREGIGWAAYQENMPTDGYTGFSFASTNYLDGSRPAYTYYARKHNPTISYESVARVPSRAVRHRNFNDFAADVNASALPQWVFVTPNLVNDAHDTTIDFAGAWLRFWLEPLLDDARFNDGRTLILLTFDENENYKINNRVFSLLLGGAVPERMRGTVDSAYYTHYSTLSSVQANWALGHLGRGDVDPLMSNVFALVADTVGHVNADVRDEDVPLTNITGTIRGPLNARPDLATATYPPADASAAGAGGGPAVLAPDMGAGAEEVVVVSAPAYIGTRWTPGFAGAGYAYVFPVLFVTAMGTAVVLARRA
ncbi:phosphoesterase family-domain-containing protein, partial [Vararia minispora EC-137]